MNALLVVALVIGLTTVGVITAIVLLVASGRTVPFPTSPAAWSTRWFR